MHVNLGWKRPPRAADGKLPGETLPLARDRGPATRSDTGGGPVAWNGCLSAAGAAILAAACGIAPAAATEPTSCLLVNRRGTDEVTEVKVTFEARGRLRSEDTASPEPVTAEMKVTAQLKYDERLLPAAKGKGGDGPSFQRAARYYHHGGARLQAGDHIEQTGLAEPMLVLAAEGIPPRVCPVEGHLTRDQLDMLLVPGSSLSASRLLPGREVRVGDEWRATSEDLALLLNLDEVATHDVGSELVEISRGLARIRLTGHLTGSVNGAKTRLQIKGDYRFDLRWERLTWLHLVLREQRDQGPAQPAFDITAELRMLLSPQASPAGLARADVARVAQLDPQGLSTLQFSVGRAAHRMLFDRDWHVIDDRPNSTVLRLVERGKLIAQCNLRELPPLPPGKSLSLEEFQTDIQHALKDRFQEFASAGDAAHPRDYRVLRVVARGMISEVPICWIYYHVSDRSGSRLAYVYTMDVESMEDFRDRDRLMVESLILGVRPAGEGHAARDAGGGGPTTAAVPRNASHR